jgi:thiamine pyrophosphate-dependent acetolactate synthase large subunit-like protein
VLVLNNGLYAIEQFLLRPSYFQPGATEDPLFYHVLAPWSYARIGEALGGHARRVRTADELRVALAEARAIPDAPTLVEVMMPPRDLQPENRATIEIAPVYGEHSRSRFAARAAAAHNPADPAQGSH